MVKVELEKRRCRECGKWFTPRSKNQIYCEDLHYRPCPVCGKLVEAKYLSDPARCCSNECKAIMRSKTREEAKSKRVSNISISSKKPKIETPSVSDSEYENYLRENSVIKTYIFKNSICGFQTEHEYAIETTKRNDSYVHDVNATYDFTEGKTVDLSMQVASMSSFQRYFK